MILLKISVMILMLFMTTNSMAGNSPACEEWHLWQAYAKRFIQPDGRILDSGIEPQTTSSEAQAYSLFFSLVANDKTRFATILNWTQQNLAQGDLTLRLPGWNWGKKSEQDWSLIDSNPATDADMWLAYTLLQAGMLWHNPKYTALGQIILDQIKKQELISLPYLGPMLLPGPLGFELNDHQWRLNPSYFPIQQLRYFKIADPHGPWDTIATNVVGMVKSTTPKGFVPDWVLYDAKKGWRTDETKGSLGSYDAIRFYLWTGMLNNNEPLKSVLLQQLHGMEAFLTKASTTPPHKINTVTGEYEHGAPAGFSAALIPYLASLRSSTLLKRQKQIVLVKQGNEGLIGTSPRYYDQALSLFALGWEERRFRFSQQGHLLPAWANQCE